MSSKVLLLGLVLLLASSVIGCAPVVDDGEVKPPVVDDGEVKPPVVDDGEVKPPLPVIVAFGATPTQISAGESATLLWNVRRATTVSIDQGIGNVTESVWYGVDADGQYSVYSGTRSVSPASTTTYTLTLSNAAGTVTKSVVIIVKEPPPENYLAAYFYEDGNIYLGGDKRPIELINNPDATDPTYAELVEFIKADITDTTIYEEWRYVCADFAEDVHNNAEAAGIRAAWVFIDVGAGHALNAFETTDRGLVYIDGTGLNRWDLMTTAKNPPVYSTYSKDRVAYIEIGKEYGLIDIDIAKSLSYSFYEEHQKKWQEYETKLEAYETELEAYETERYEGSLERERIRAWAAELKEKWQELVELREELGNIRDAPGIVQDINIHWGPDKSDTGPVISGVDISRITESRADIKWRTDERAISWVE